MSNARVPLLLMLLGSVLLPAVLLSGCKGLHKTPAVAAKPKAAPPAPTMLPVDLTKVQPNELGVVPILEYHDLVNTNKTTGYQYPAASFRKDMDWLYAHHYRPISLSDYVQGKIDCPAGTSPVILTFDDALRGQFHYTDTGQIDPNCAVAILDALHAAHPDWPLKGTFFVLTDQDPKLPPPFYQAATAQGKMEYLVREGYEVGNHTVHHRAGIRHWTDAQVMAEFAGAVLGIHKYLPGYNVQTLALPYGVYPKNRKLVVQGQSGGQSYQNICALLAGANPAPSPMDTAFNPYRLPRIIPGNQRLALRYWMDWLEKNKGQKFVSDGDPNTFTVNALATGQISKARLQKRHFFLRTYTGTQVVTPAPPGLAKPAAAPPAK